LEQVPAVKRSPSRIVGSSGTDATSWSIRPVPSRDAGAHAHRSEASATVVPLEPPALVTLLEPVAPPRVVLATARGERRWAVRRTLERCPYDVVAEVDGGVAGSQACLDAVDEHAADAVVIELDPIDGHGLLVVQQLALTLPRGALVVLADVTDPHLLELVLRSGASGVVRRDAAPLDLVSQVDALLSLALSGQEYPEPA
jgi:hypothetical protein